MENNPAKNLNGAKILVCSGAGFIGSNFIYYLFSKYPKVKITNFDKLTYSGNLDNLKGIANNSRYSFIRGDIADQKALEKVIKKIKPEYIVNFAAETHVDKSIHEGLRQFIFTNIEGVFNVLEVIRKIGRVKKYIQVSTDEVFGSLKLNSKEKFNERTPLLPNTPYAATKAGGDLLCRSYYATWRAPAIVTHCSNNYGPYQYPEKLIPFFIIRMLEGKKLPLYGDGRNIRDWIYVLDHCRALELCLLKGTVGETYNIGAGNEKSNLEIAKMILSYFNRDESWIEFVADRPGHDRRYAIDFSKIKNELRWKPKYDFKKSFKRTIKWYLRNKRWINNLGKKIKNFNPHIKK